MWDILLSGWTPDLLALSAWISWKCAVRPWVDKDTRESAFVVKRVRGGGGWISTTYRVRCLFCGWETNTGRTPAGRCGRCGGHIAQAPADPVKTARRAPLGGYQPAEKHTKPDPTPAPPPPPGKR